MSNPFIKVTWYICLFVDGMFSTGSVWTINGIIEWFEENRPK